MMAEIQKQVQLAFSQLLEQASLHPGDLVVVGCSSSEIIGKKIGSVGSMEAAEAVWAGLEPLLREHGLFLAAQCCEHLNRALVIEREAARLHHLPEVNAVPQPHAGGSFATTVYAKMTDPVVVEHVSAAAGMDIGGTLIGMHLREVAVPVRVSLSHIGEATLILARSRARFIGGERTHYNPALM